MTAATKIGLIEEAIQACLDADREVPLEWISEYLLIVLRSHQEPRFRISLTNPKEFSGVH
jgi:hypothetical protein